MKPFTSTLIALCISTALWSQQKVSVVGESGMSIPGAKVICTYTDAPDSTVLITNAEGIFLLKQPGSVRVIRIYATGYWELADTINGEVPNQFVLTESTELDAVCVTAQYQPTVANNAIQKITIIGKEKIEQSGANNLSELLTYQTGIRVNNHSILGSTMDLSGISGQNVKILIDGVPVIGRRNGNIDLSQINMNNVERIEIVEGPLSVSFGSNALAGTINVITKKSLSGGFTFELNPYYESSGNYNLILTTGIRIKEHNLLINAGRNYFDGWSASDPFIEFPKSKPADTNRFKTWKPKEQYYGEARYSTSVKGWQIAPYVRYFDEMVVNRGFPTQPYFESAFDDYYSTKRLDVGTTFNKQFKKSGLKGQFAYNRYDRIKNTFYKDLTTLDEVLSETTGAQDTSAFSLINGRLTYQSIRKKKFDYQFGCDINFESAKGKRILNEYQEIGDYAIFTTAEWKPIKSVIVRPGLRYAYNSVYPAPLTPSLNIKFRHKGFTARAAVAKGFRSPTLKELYFEFVDINHNIHGNTELLSEDSWNYSLHLDWMRHTSKNYLLKLSYGVYYNDINNLITLGLLTEGTNYYSYLNIGDYKTFGNQLSFDFRSRKLTVGINTSYIGRFNPDSESEDVPEFNFSPEIGSRISYRILNDRLFFNVFYKYNGPLQSFNINEDDEIETSTQSPYSILDVSSSVRLLQQRQLHFTIGCKNLLNVKQINVIGQSQTGHSTTTGLNAGRGISFFVSAKYTFNYSFKDEKNQTDK